MTAQVVAITTDELHTGGEPVRIVTGGYPPIEGRTILEKRAFAASQLDHLRKLLMWEPRGHRDMYGVIPVTPDDPNAALAVLFIHTEGYSTMCGHATIALGRWAVESGRVAAVEPITNFVLQCPCGPVQVAVEVAGGTVGRVSFESVPAFAFALDQVVDVEGAGPVGFDVGYGGAFYAIAPAAAMGVDLAGPIADIEEAGFRLAKAVARSITISYPQEPDLSFLYGSILTDGGDGIAAPSRNVCIFAGRQIDRSPTGSGVTARMAIAAARGEDMSATRKFESITGAIFEGRVIETIAGRHPSVIVEVSGHAHWSGSSQFVLDPSDPLGAGFLLR